MVRPGSNTTTMTWLSEVKRSLISDHYGRRNSSASSSSTTITTTTTGVRITATLGILAFDTAKIIARLLSLHKSLSDDEIIKLRKDVMRSKGVSYLNSKDQGFLLYLACAEVLEDLDSVAIAIAQLGRKCADIGLSRFDLVYKDLKMGIIDVSKMKFASGKDAGKLIEKMERFVYATADLYTASESLSEMEGSHQKLQTWKNVDDDKMARQRRQVRQLRDASLWNQTFDTVVGLMARAVCAVYTRVGVVFGPQISLLPTPRFSRSASNKHICPLPTNGRASKSGPIAIAPKQRLMAQAFGRKPSLNFSDNLGFGMGFGVEEQRGGFRFDEMGKHNSVYQGAPPSTVGGSGLALRYASIIILAERCLKAAASIGEDARQELYQKLPARLKAMVKWKLRKDDAAAGEEDAEAAERWRESLNGILEWLAPMAHDTMRWQAARSVEKQMFEGKPRALLLQTLHYSNREKAEAAIVEVLVGLCCLLRYENRRAFDFGFRNSPFRRGP